MVNRNLLFLLIIILSEHSCLSSKTDDSTEQRSFKDSLTLVYKKENRFELDSNSTAQTRSIQLFPADNPKYLIFHHLYQNKLSIFDLKSKKCKAKLEFNKDGPNGVGEGIRAMYFHNFDSIFFMALLEQRLYLVDSARNLKNKYNLSSASAYCQLGTIYPAIFKSNAMYLCTTPFPNANIPPNSFADVKLNLSNGSIEHVFPLSPKYFEGWWGRHHYLRISHTYNPFSKEIVLSYPNDHFISVVDEGHSVKRYLAPARNISKLRPVSREYQETDDNLIYQLETRQGSYSGILFDRWRNLYYRLAFNPIVNYSSPFDSERAISIVILDKNFKKVGEFDFQKDMYSYLGIFISPDGLNILNMKKYNEIDQDNLTFAVFEIKIF